MSARLEREVVRTQLWRAMSTGDVAAGCAIVAAELDSGVPGGDVVTRLLAPLQRSVGLRWQSGEWSVADEHVATAVVDAALGVIEHNGATAGPGRPLVAVACAETEWHAMPARMFAQLLREAGFGVRFLGASQPADHLREHLARLQPAALAVSATTPAALAGAARTIEAATSVGVRTVAGGAAWGADARRATLLGADAWAADLGAVVRLLRVPLQRDVPRLSRHEGWQGYRSVTECAPEAVASAYADLVAELPGISDLDQAGLRYLRDALTQVTDTLAVAFLVDDPRVIEQHTGWLCELLGARGVPRASVVAGCLALGRHLPDAAANLLASSAATAYGTG